MLRAFIEKVLRSRIGKGGSAITQEVVKTFLLSPERTLRLRAGDHPGSAAVRKTVETAIRYLKYTCGVS